MRQMPLEQKNTAILETHAFFKSEIRRESQLLDFSKHAFVGGLSGNTFIDAGAESQPVLTVVGTLLERSAAGIKNHAVQAEHTNGAAENAPAAELKTEEIIRRAGTAQGTGSGEEGVQHVFHDSPFAER